MWLKTFQQLIQKVKPYLDCKIVRQLINCAPLTLKDLVYHNQGEVLGRVA